MTQIKNYIAKPQSSYRIVSFGINPGVPLFNGFYCLDGYSTNYSLNYKHRFRKIIARELRKNQKNKQFYNHNGLRVYLVSHKFKYFIPDDFYQSETEFNDLDMNYRALKELKCDYIFSRFKINNVQEYIKLEKVFENDFTKIYLYSLL